MQASTDQFDEIELRGGLDLLTPMNKVRSGSARDAQNFEQSVTGGYSRIAGYERFSGKPKPSAAVYGTLSANITGSIVVGNTIVGVTSGATGVVISLTGTLVAYTKATGTFLVGETLNVGGSPQGTVVDLGGVDTAIDWDAIQRSLAAAVYRADIAAVPGSGPVRGVAKLGDVVYAWRNTAPGTAMAIYKSTATGWSAVPLGFTLAFTAGSTAYAEGATITKGGASAIVRRISLESGSWGSGTAAGRFILSSVTGGPFTAGVAGGGGVATLSGAEVAITLAPNGSVQTDTANFGGGPRLYGCDGVNLGFEFDGTYYVPIKTGMAVDAPTQVMEHKGHLFFAFGTNLMNSSIASIANLYPQYNWTATLGAVQYAFESEIVGLRRQPGNQETGAAAILLESGVKMLYGSSAADFKPVSFEESAGAKKYTAQPIGGQLIAFGGTGAFSIASTQAYGNFASNALTMNIRPFTQVRRNLASASLVNKEKSQYRIFFSDGYGLYMTIANGKLVGMLPVYFPNPVTCACSGTSPDGAETAYFGSSNGFVYELDAGTSFDGGAIDAYMTLCFADQGNAQRLKNYRGAAFEVQGGGYAEFGVTYEVGYGTEDLEQGWQEQTVEASLTPVYWDAFTWDNFVWDGKSLKPGRIEIDGTAENIALRIASNSALHDPFTINSIALRFKARRSIRGGAA